MPFKVLTDLQSKVLMALFDRGFGDEGYFLSGGTALSEFYLQHRYSDDLDFFTRKPDPLDKDFRKVQEILASVGLTIDEQPETDADFGRFFVYPEGQIENQLKLEFIKDVAAQMDEPQTHERIVMDSFEDIAVNKICAIYGREPPDLKDYCDLFFILKESRYTLDYLIGRAREKDAVFDGEDGTLVFATNLHRVQKLRKLPRMIKPLGLEELRTFLVPMAEELIQRLRPGQQ
ncbi:MAG: nucleotidyl transferase AbiEii/AbiGii toxin family protein [Acidobacteria bacterium]|nr:nucleotidyl transferase AbiEii/AbiGii toxin family protein [Acidobacteriota bacterium]MBI3655397.1 nucleotidyl transferase AbiEii/AbiGii toxin family protein [Acidobacteriota bacterium]